MSTEALKALEACANQFAFYADEHRKAGKIEKAETNERFRDMARSALTQASEPVGWQWLHNDPISGKPYWHEDQYRNGNRSEISRPLFTSPQPPAPDSEACATAMSDLQRLGQEFDSADTVVVSREDLQDCIDSVDGWIIHHEQSVDGHAPTECARLNRLKTRLSQALQVVR